MQKWRWTPSYQWMKSPIWNHMIKMNWEVNTRSWDATNWFIRFCSPSCSAWSPGMPKFSMGGKPIPRPSAKQWGLPQLTSKYKENGGHFRSEKFGSLEAEGSMPQRARKQALTITNLLPWDTKGPRCNTKPMKVSVYCNYCKMKIKIKSAKPPITAQDTPPPGREVSMQKVSMQRNKMNHKTIGKLIATKKARVRDIVAVCGCYCCA